MAESPRCDRARLVRVVAWVALAVSMVVAMPARAEVPAEVAAALAAELGIPEPGLETTTPVSTVAVERFHYTWKLSKFLGWIAGFFLPSRGAGTLTFEPLAENRMRGELMITSQDSESGEFWGYETEMDLESGYTLRAGSSYSFNGKQRQKQAEIGDEGVFDVASTIYWLRRELPRHSRRIEVWSDGKIYPVLVQLKGVSKRKVGDQRITARRYIIAAAPGATVRWKGKLELWIAEDPEATPIEIVVHRGGAAVRMRLAEPTSPTR